jgi:class 3 adenylate cyclase
MCVTNLVKAQANDHAKRIALFSLEAMQIARNTPIDLDNLAMGTINLRAGFHSGPVIASVIGSRNLKYSIFGDTVNTSSRMESTSLPGRIQLSERAAQILQEQYPLADLVLRGNIAVKGKGEMRTFFLKEKKTARHG